MSRPDPHYFLGKTEILDWLNSTLSLNLQKVEDTSNGAVACQLMDAIHRSQGGVSLKQVDFNAKTEYDSLNNYKVLQQAFLKYGVQKSADSAKLVKGKPLDNLEFMQWFKASDQTMIRFYLAIWIQLDIISHIHTPSPTLTR